MRLNISDAARRDLHDLYAYGSEVYGERSARSYLDNLLRAMERLPDFPFAARIRTEVRPPVRLIVHLAHNVFYDVHDDEVEILRVLHHSADWKNLL